MTAESWQMLLSGNKPIKRAIAVIFIVAKIGIKPEL